MAGSQEQRCRCCMIRHLLGCLWRLEAGLGVRDPGD